MSKCTSRLGWSGALAAALGLIGSGWILAGQDAVPARAVVPPTVEELVTQLGAEAYAEREAATRALLKRGADVLPKLEAALDRADDLEVRYRLEYILANATPPERAALVVRPQPGSGLAPGDLVTHVNGRAIRTASELRQWLSLADRSGFDFGLGGALLRVYGADGPREVGPVDVRQLEAVADYVAPRGAVLAEVVRKYAAGFAEEAYALLQGLDTRPPADELSPALRARIAHTAGAGEAALEILRTSSEMIGLAEAVLRDASDDLWSSPSRLDLAGPGPAPYALEWWLMSQQGAAMARSANDPDLRVQRVLVPANRFVEALQRAVGFWFDHYRDVLEDMAGGRNLIDSQRVAGNMIAVVAWMFHELELHSECCRLIGPRSAILQASPGGPSTWVRVDTEAWLPFLRGEIDVAIDAFFAPAREVLQRPLGSPNRNVLIRNPEVAARIAFFLYQAPEDARVGQMLEVVNRVGDPWLADYVEWMLYSVQPGNEQRVRTDLRMILPSLVDTQVATAAWAVILMEYVADQPDREVVRTAIQRLQQAPETPENRQRVRAAEVLRALLDEQYARAWEATESLRDDMLYRPLVETARFVADPPPGARVHEALDGVRLAVPLGPDGGQWLVVTRQRRLARFDVAGGEVVPVAPPSSSWYPGPVNWPWLGRGAEPGRTWVFDRRRVFEVAGGGYEGARFNIRPADIPVFARHAGTCFGIISDALVRHGLPDIGDVLPERGGFLRQEIQANFSYVDDPDLPTLGKLDVLGPEARFTYCGFRGGPHLLVDGAAGRVYDSEWLAEQVGLDRGPVFFPVVPAEYGAADVYLLTDQGLLRLNTETEEVVRLPMPGETPYPPLTPEIMPYDRADQRFVYFAEHPEAGGAVYRLVRTSGAVEALEIRNLALPPGWYQVQDRAALRERLSATFVDAGYLPLQEFIRDTQEVVEKWSGRRP